MVAASTPPVTGPPAKPLLFISHRHEDKTVADVLRSFIVTRTANRVDVFQSSSAEAIGPKVGGPLNKALMDVIWTADVFLLLYTSKNKDWSYCTWEYGVALDDHAPDARPVLLQFSDDFPDLFADQVRVDVRKRDDVLRFTQQLLCGNDFFLNHPGSVTDFARDSLEVRRAGEELFDSLQAVAPKEGTEPDPWPSYPYMQIVIGYEHLSPICDSGVGWSQRVQMTRDVLETEAVVSYGDAEAGRLFGRRSQIVSAPFKDLLERWSDRFTGADTTWVDAICRQIASAAVDDFPTLEWHLIRACDPGDGTWYGPALIQSQRSPRQQAMKFDVCFLKFALDDTGRVIAAVQRTTDPIS
ncbi:MAG: toll/interleukin-1 receptor domain-containing protein [Acidobacteria bacterium]|nr:toll/interleukin-1 receptor domain-containing protein [Acidobacteriota bacterium]